MGLKDYFDAKKKILKLILFVIICIFIGERKARAPIHWSTSQMPRIGPEPGAGNSIQLLAQGQQ